MLNGAEGGAGAGAAPTVEAVAPPSQDPLIGRTLDGRYRIDAVIAAGGMGRVYVAHQLSLGRKVAVKVLALTQMHIRSDAQFLQRFTHEAATASRVNSPNAVTIFDFGHTEDDLYYLVMELVEGKTLAQVLRKERVFGPARTIRVAIQIALALKEAHRHGIVHRDIKPGNLVLCAPVYEFVKVLDFGIAKLVERDNADAMANLTASGTFVGTPEYCAPEALMGHADLRSDLYSLGVVMYLMLQGRLPFKGESPAETISMVLNDPVPLMNADYDIPPALEAVVMRLLENQAEMRFQTVDNLLLALEVVSRQLSMDVRISGIGEIPSGVAPTEVDLDLQPMTGVHAEDAVGERRKSRWPAWLSTRAQRVAFMASVLGVWAVGGALLAFLYTSDQAHEHAERHEQAGPQLSPPQPSPQDQIQPSIQAERQSEKESPNRVHSISDSTPSKTPAEGASRAESPSQLDDTQRKAEQSMPAKWTPSNTSGKATRDDRIRSPQEGKSGPSHVPRVETPERTQPTTQVDPPSQGSQENGYKPSPY